MARIGDAEGILEIELRWVLERGFVVVKS